MYRLELYKLWLGFLERVILLLLAAIVIPMVVGAVSLPASIVISWLFIGVALVLFYVILSVRAKRLAEALEEEDKRT